MALISDAGTPLISDPGYKLVREALEAGFQGVTSVPARRRRSPRSPAQGCRPTRFCSLASCRRREAARRARLTELARIDATLVMFESGNRVQDTLADLADIMGDARRRDLPRTDKAARRDHARADR